MTEPWPRLVQRAVVDRLEKIKEWEQKMIELPPGLELDKLIAEKVLGWKPSTWPGLWIDDMCKENSLSNFSTNIKAAWDLVEKFKLCVVPYGNQWTATRLGQIFIDSERNLAPTAPHAICLAALFYAGEDDE